MYTYLLKRDTKKEKIVVINRRYKRKWKAKKELH